MEDQDVAPNMKEWLECNGRVILIGWRKVKKKKGGKATVWAPRIKEYTADDFSDKAEKPRVRVKQEAMIERWGDLYR
uniref:Uncharacterized protein n=1 Tax=viral metagenome TaxID=1070528 RepID=A0A6M3L687_9ZZZZ